MVLRQQYSLGHIIMRLIDIIDDGGDIEDHYDELYDLQYWLTAERFDRSRPKKTSPAAPYVSINAAVESAEGRTILAALQRNAYNRKAAAAELGMHKSTLFAKSRNLDFPFLL